MWKVAFELAAYIIEATERNFPDKKGEWRVDDKDFDKETYPYFLADGSKIFPVAWCMKRIVDGKGDDVWFKYRVTIMKDRSHTKEVRIV